MPAIEPGYKTNFETLCRAVRDNHIALLACQDKATGKPVRVVVAVNFDGQEYEMIPLAKLFDGNPFEELNPPNPDATGPEYGG